MGSFKLLCQHNSGLQRNAARNETHTTQTHSECRPAHSRIRSRPCWRALCMCCKRSFHVICKSPTLGVQTLHKHSETNINTHTPKHKVQIPQQTYVFSVQCKTCRAVSCRKTINLPFSKSIFPILCLARPPHHICSARERVTPTGAQSEVEAHLVMHKYAEKGSSVALHCETNVPPEKLYKVSFWRCCSCSVVVSCWRFDVCVCVCSYV